MTTDYTSCGKAISIRPVGRGFITLYCDLPVNHEDDKHHAEINWADTGMMAQK